MAFELILTAVNHIIPHVYRKYECKHQNEKVSWRDIDDDSTNLFVEASETTCIFPINSNYFQLQLSGVVAPAGEGDEREREAGKSWKMRTNIQGRSGCVRGARRDVNARLVHWILLSFTPRGQPPDRTSVPGFPLTLLACLWISASAGLAPVWTRLNARRHGHERSGTTDGVA